MNDLYFFIVAGLIIGMFVCGTIFIWNMNSNTKKNVTSHENDDLKILLQMATKKESEMPEKEYWNRVRKLRGGRDISQEPPKVVNDDEYWHLEKEDLTRKTEKTHAVSRPSTRIIKN